jgi:hypothetical protein
VGARFSADDEGGGFLAKVLVRAMLADDVDLGDEEAVARWLDGFAERPVEERDAILGYGLESLPTLPSRPLPPPEEVAQSASTAPVLERFRVLHAFCAPPGRRLTAKDNLTLTDAVYLVDELGTGDLLDAPRSAADLLGLELTVRWARQAGVVRTRHGRLVATASWARLASDPEAAFRRALGALLDIGPLTARSSRPGWARGAEAEIVEDCLPHLLAVLWASDEPVGFEEFLDVTAQVVDDQLEADGWSTFEQRREYARLELDTVVDALALAGVLVRQAARIEPGELDDRRRVGGRLSLTPAGWAALPGILAGYGYEAPVVGAWAEGGAEALLTACAEMDAESMEAELTAWLDDRRPDESVAELAQAVVAAKSAEVRLLGFHALGKLPEVAEPTVRRLALTPVAGYARLWLVEHGYEDGVVGPDDLPETVLEVLGAALDQGGDEGLVDAVAGVGPPGEQLELIGRLRRVPSETTVPVLEAIGRHHPDGDVAKAARRAVLQHRSWMAGG